MEGFIKNCDYFGFTPQFLHSGDIKYKTKLGGLIFLIFAIFSLYYVVYGFYVFIKSRSDVDTSRDILKYSGTYNLSTTELYFGVGFVNHNFTEYNLSSFPYFNIYLMIFDIKTNGTRKITTVQMTPCNLDYLIDWDSLYLYTEEQLNTIKLRYKYYLCPPDNFTLEFNPIDFSGDTSYLQITFDYMNVSVLSLVENQINQERPKINFIYKNIFIDSENKSHPYNGYIDSFYREIDYESSKSVDLSLNPYEIHDDDGLLGSKSYEPVKSDSSKQPNGTIFTTTIKTSQNAIYNNRSENLNFNDNKPFLNFFNVNIYLNTILGMTLRSFKKFPTFLAETTTILSNLLMIITILMLKYNSIQGKNDMIMSLFDHNSIKNLKSFTDDFKPIFEERKKHIYSPIKSIFKKRAKESLRKNQFKESLLSFHINLNNPPENSSTFEEQKIDFTTKRIDNKILFKIPKNDKPLEELPEDLDKIKIIDMTAEKSANRNLIYNLSDIKLQDNIIELKPRENAIELKPPGNFSHLEEMMNVIINEKLEFSFVDYLSSLFYSKTKSSVLYLNGIDNLDFIMDIERYLKFNLDMTLVKEVLFDNTQRLVFDTITKLISFKRFFDKNKEKYVDFSSYKKEDYESFFKGIKCMSSRYDTTDNKIIKFIEERIEN